jgi:hypothetical protein
MKKNRHIKTLGERYGVDESFTNKDDILKYKSEIVQKIRQYENYNSKKAIKNKTEFRIDIEQAMRDLFINYKGILYLRALGKFNPDDEHQKQGVFEDGVWKPYGDYNDAYFIQYDDTPMKRVKLKSDSKPGDKDYMEYTKYYVMKISTNGWYFLLFVDYYNRLDWIVRKNDLLVEGNIGTLLK